MLKLLLANECPKIQQVHYYARMVFWRRSGGMVWMVGVKTVTSIWI